MKEVHLPNLLHSHCVTIQGQKGRHDAVIDHQANQNYVSVRLVHTQDLKAIKRPPQFTPTDVKLPNGNTCQTLGVLFVSLRIGRKGALSQQEFYVLPRTIKPFILGVPFLRAKTGGNTTVLRYTTAGLPPATQGLNLMLNEGAGRNMMMGDAANHSPTHPLGIQLGDGGKIVASGKKVKVTFPQSPEAIDGDFAIFGGLPANLLLLSNNLAKNVPNNRLQWQQQSNWGAGLYCCRVEDHKEIDLSKLNLFVLTFYSVSFNLRFI